MNWLYSIVLAGLMFTSESELMPGAQPAYKGQSTSAIVKLDETERFEQSYPLNANGRVNVSNVNGSITVEAWDKNEVKLEAVKVADTKENLADVEFKINARQDSFSVEADYDNLHRRDNSGWKNYRKLEVQFRLTVPRTAILDEIETVNGSVTVSNFVNTTKVSAVNGEVRATNLRGTASLSTVNGTVDAVFDSLDAGSKISLNTVNGRVNLQIPSDSNATIKADTLNGEIKNDFGLPVRKGEYVGKDLYGKIGTGDVNIRLNSVNGGLTIARKNDGKSPNQATNLLSQNENNERNPAIRNQPKQAVNTAKINREIARAVADSQQETAKAMKEAEKELKKLTPEIAKITEESLKESVEVLNQTNEMLNSPEFKLKLKEAEKMQFESLSRLSDISWNIGAPRVEKKTATFAVKGTPKVTIDAKDCAVAVRGWDKSEVQYSVKKYSRNRNQSPVDVRVENTDSSVNINVVDAGRSSRGESFFDDDGSDVRIEVYVPKKSNLRVTTNGELRLEGVSGDIELNGVDESINVRDSGGKLRVTAADGRIRVVGFSGELTAKSGDGETYLEGAFEKLSATTVDGDIILTLPENSDINLESNLREIDADGFNLQEIGTNEKSSRWKIGKGGANYLLYTTADGRISLRGKSMLTAQN